MVKTRKKRGGGLFTFFSGLFGSNKNTPTNNVSQGQPIQPEGQPTETQPLIPINFTPPNQNEYNLLVSHNNRIQSWLDRLLKTNDYFLGIFNNYGKMRFSNGAAISLVFDNDRVLIDLVYPGDASSNKYDEDKKTNTKRYEPYWGLTEDNLINVRKFEPFVIELDIFMKTSNIASIELIQNLIGKNFLIVRHGEATHNLKIRNKFDYDTLLTKLGVEQAKSLGRALNGKIKINNKNCYVSDLIRTGMTAWAIGTQLFGDESFDNYIVVPCNNEVTDAKGDRYMTVMNITGDYQNENKTLCKVGKPCYRGFNVDGVQVNLTSKYNFNFNDTFKKSKRCKNDFFQQLNIVFSSNNPVTPTVQNSAVKPPLNPISDLQTSLSPAPAPGFAPPVAAAAGGSNYKRTQKMKYGKKFTKKGGRKNNNKSKKSKK